MSKIFVDQVDPKTGTSLTLGTSGDTVNIPSGVTLANAGTVTGLPASAISSGTIATARLGSGTASSSTFLRGDQTYAAAGGDNTPAFRVRSTAGQTVSNATWTKCEWNTEDKDTDSAFDLSNERFTVPSGKGGLYSFQWSIENNGKVSSNAVYQVILAKNGTNQTDLFSRQNPTTTGTFDVYNNGGGGIVLSAGDYVELFYYQNGGGTVTLEGNYRSWTGFKVTT